MTTEAGNSWKGLKEFMSVNITEIFGTNVFSMSVMRERLPKKAYAEVVDVMEKTLFSPEGGCYLSEWDAPTLSSATGS